MADVESGTKHQKTSFAKAITVSVGLRRNPSTNTEQRDISNLMKRIKSLLENSTSVVIIERAFGRLRVRLNNWGQVSQHVSLRSSIWLFQSSPPLIARILRRFFVTQTFRIMFRGYDANEPREFCSRQQRRPASSLFGCQALSILAQKSFEILITYVKTYYTFGCMFYELHTSTH